MPHRYYLSAREAAGALGVTPATLYAYTSRGQLRSEPVPGRPRERRYARADVERLRERKEARRDPSKAAARGLHWGDPVLESAITLIHNGRFYFRGRDAVRFAESASLERAAALLWETDEAHSGRLFEQPPVCPIRQLARLRTAAADPLTMFQAALPLAGAQDVAAHDLRPDAVRKTAARIVSLLTMSVTGRPVTRAIHLEIGNAWAPRKDAVGEVARQAMVLSADHELNISAFAARCTASAGATPYDVVSAAMATLKGYKHGGAAARVSALFAEAGSPGAARSAIARRLRHGESVPGFGHPLYPAGDPRALVLLDLARQSGNEREWRNVRALWKAGLDLLADHPTLDFALAAMARAYELPDEAPMTLFALGRTIGWMAHAMEEYASGRTIRPRARYTGLAPEGLRPYP